TRSDYDETSMIESGIGASIVDGGENVFSAPIFAGGLLNFTEAWDSPTLAVGAPSPPDPAVGSLDLAGNPRTVDGLTDMGAFQYQAPVATASPSAASAQLGSSITFTGSATDSNSNHSTLTYRWSFDDGGSATGAVVAHTFTTAGSHTATLTVGDGSPYTATATATVSITAPPSVAPTPTPTPTPSSLVAPTLTGSALSTFQAVAKHGKHKAKPFSAKLSFTLSEPASVTGTLSELLKGERVKGRCESALVLSEAKVTKATCPHSKTLHSFTISAVAGNNTVALPHAASLEPGRYRVTLYASSGSLESDATILSFEVKQRAA
ncbi:MAG TPA: PKD domain-containing protein, partial [Solirubrobacteraceae bacterium]|nr:PKD domain-containing protein [Solirubrobacteraceae bacterium]